MAEKTKEKIQSSEEIDIFLSNLVPKHELLDDDEKKRFLNEFNVSEKQLPKIRHTDPVIKRLGAKKGDVIRIERKSATAGEYYYYRVVV
ncbi:MAG: DNA-directed RNA polymerase subunit H [Candidatus Aenigmarchaeota archaeon]|nr:DNA-directed RNA polymerase subunit H [Candidatus Aenigmarchaeota archaeon]